MTTAESANALPAEDIGFDLPLPVLFERACSLHDQAEVASLSTFTTQSAVDMLRRCSAMVDALGVFSRNEELEDVATADLRFLLIPKLLGDLLARTSLREPAERAAELDQAAAEYTRFLESSRQLGLARDQLDGADEAAPDDGSGGAAAGGSAAARRAAKIARFKLERSVRTRLEELGAQRLRRLCLAELEANDADGERGGGGDAEEDREAALLRLHLASVQAGEQRAMLMQEVDMLKRAAALPAEQRAAPPQPPPAELLAALRAAADSLGGGSGGGGAGDRRAAHRAAVFRPGIAAPTVTLAQQAEQELRAARAAEASAAKAEAARVAAQAADERAGGEAETQRQRAWDDWKDDHPRGAGNSKLRPMA
ncbi:hypothetical protein WJX81_005866 [Elliptochloris bilobata]|uniref:TAP42-like protein n=1 Tax=Elliptochloris bilobata TaxID=381761 RepID=A0AAW1RU05_9CHLO